MKTQFKVLLLISFVLFSFSCKKKNDIIDDNNFGKKCEEPSPRPEIKILNFSEKMAYAKKNMNIIPNGITALNSLKKSADKELTKKPESVVDKEITAASGDKHDYISMGPYWWPDLSKPDGLPYIRKDGERNPEISKYDKDKLNSFIKSVKTLSYAYYFSGEKKYADKVIEFLCVWFLDETTKMNPNLNFGQIIPGRNKNKGRGEGIIETYGFIEMLNCINLLIEDSVLPTQKEKELKQWYSSFLDWMLTSEVGLDEKSSKNNHGISYDVQVTAYAVFTGRLDLARKYINKFAEDRLFKQIEPDGKQPLELARTLALHYSIFNLDHIIDMCYLAEGLNIWLYGSLSNDGRSIEKAVKYVSQFLGKNQLEFPYKQISGWDECQIKLSWLLRRSTFFDPNEIYDEAIEKHNRTKHSDIRWLTECSTD